MSTTEIPVDQLPIQLTDEDVENLLDCAGYGIGYWAKSCTVDPCAKIYTINEDTFAPAGEKALSGVYTFDEVRRAFNTLAEKKMLPAFQVREIAEKELSFDATVGDLVTQWLLFAEIVYG